MKPAFMVLVLLGAVGGGVVLASQVIDINANTVVTRRDVEDVKKRLRRIETVLAQMHSTQEQVQGALERIEGKFAHEDAIQTDLGVLQLAPDEAALIRDTIFGEPGVKPDMRTSVQARDSVQNVAPRRVPATLVAKFPKLKGLRYVIDSNWAIALVAPTKDRVVAVIPPI